MDSLEALLTAMENAPDQESRDVAIDRLVAFCESRRGTGAMIFIPMDIRDRFQRISHLVEDRLQNCNSTPHTGGSDHREM